MEISETGKWAAYLADEAGKPYFSGLCQAVEEAYAASTVYPPREEVFSALQLTPPEAVRVVILGQDPYHEPGQAHGLSFSVKLGTRMPKSLQNIYKELEADLGCRPGDGCLIPWAEEGVLLLNAALTVEAHRAGSHRNLGWEQFTDGIITATNRLNQPIAFLLWGSWAQKKQSLIQTDAPRLILTAPHPSPLSAYRGFFGSRPFSKINGFLEANGEPAIRWG